MNDDVTSTSGRKNNLSLLWNVLKVFLALGLVYFVFSKTDPAALASTLRNARIPWLVISALLFLSLTLLKALQYHTLMRNDLSYPQVLNLIVWQNAVSNFFLSGAGILTYITTSRMEHDLKVSRSVTVFLLTKVGDLTAIWLVLIVSAGLVRSEVRVLHTAILILTVGIGIAVIGFFLTLSLRQRFVSILERILRWMGILKFRLVEKGLSYLQGLANIRQEKVLTLFGRLLFFSLVYLAVTIAWMYANLAIFRLQLGIPAVMFVSVLMQLVSYFPVAVFGGLGISETSALYFWSFFNVNQELLAPALIGIRVVFYLLNLIPLIYLPVYSAFFKPKEQVHNEQ